MANHFADILPDMDQLLEEKERPTMSTMSVKLANKSRRGDHETFGMIRFATETEKQLDIWLHRVERVADGVISDGKPPDLAWCDLIGAENDSEKRLLGLDLMIMRSWVFMVCLSHSESLRTQADFKYSEGEAFTLTFHSDKVFAIRVIVDDIAARTGLPPGIHRKNGAPMSDCIITPNEKFLHGFHCGDRMVSQFVAAPKLPATGVEQKRTWGSLKFTVIPQKRVVMESIGDFINVETWYGETLQLRVFPNDKFETLKHHISKRTGISEENQILIVEEREVPNGNEYSSQRTLTAGLTTLRCHNVGLRCCVCEFQSPSYW